MSDQLKHRLVEHKPFVHEYPPQVFQTRVKKFLNQHQVRELLGVCPTTARRILAGCDLKLSQAYKLARHLGVSILDLWHLKKEEEG